MTNNQLRNVVLFGLFAVPFVAFFISSSILFPFISGKNFLFRILVEIVFVCWLILSLRDNSFLPKKSWLVYTYGIFFLMLALADLFGANFGKSFWSNFERMEGFVAHIHLFLYFVVLTSVIQTRRLWSNWWLTWLGASTIMCFYAILQLSGSIAINQGGVRVDGTFGNATYLAVFMMFMVFITMYLSVRSFLENRNWHWWLIPLGIVELIILYFTATRGAILGLLGGILLTTIIVALWGKTYPKARKVASTGLIALVVFIGGFIALRNTSFIQESPVLNRFANLSLSEIRNQGRYYIWPMALEGVSERPILGWGQENFGQIFSKHYNPAMYAQEQWFDRAHNMYLDFLVAGGILVFVPFLAIFFFFFWYLWRRDKTDFTFLEKSILTGLMSAYMFQGVFVFDNLFSYILFFSLLAYVASHVNNERFTWPDWMKATSVRKSIAVVAIIAICYTLYAWNIKPIRAGQNLIDAIIATQEGKLSEALDEFEAIAEADTMANTEAREQIVTLSGNFLTQGVPQDIKQRYADLAQKEIQAQLKENPNDARSHVFAGMLYRSLGFLDLSISELKRAVELSPTKQTIMFELGASYIAKKDYQSAVDVFKQAYELAPSFREARIIYAIGLIYVGDEQKVQEFFDTIQPEILLFDDRVATALAENNRFADLVEIFSLRLETERGIKDPQNFISLAVSYVELGQIAKAREVLNRMVELFPTYAPQVEEYLNSL